MYVESITVSGENVGVTHMFTYLWQRDSLVYQLRTCQSTTGPSLERDEFAGRRCVALPILVQMAEGPNLSLAGPPGLAVFLWYLDSDQRAKTEAELLWYYVTSPNPWLSMA